MAQVHNEIRKGWLSESANRALGRTREGGVERLGETLDPVINMWGMPEWAYLRGERLVGGANTQALVAAEYGYQAVLNPTGSNMLVVIEAANAGSGTAGISVHFGMATEAVVLATLAVTTVAFVRDRRWRDNNNFLPRAQWLTGTDGGVLAQTVLEQPSAVAVNIYAPAVTCLPVIVPPGQAFLVRGLTVALTLIANIAWRERAAYPGELV